MLTITPENAPVWLAANGYESIDDFRHEYGINTTGPIQDSDLRAMMIRRCGVKFRQARGGPTKLSTNRPKVYVRDRLKNPEFRDMFDVKLLAGLNLWSKVANISFSLTNNPGDAQIEVQVERIDGPMNTLAYAYFPQGPNYRLPLVFDSSENWESPSGTDFETTACHEGGHNIGIDHDPTAQGIMAAFYNPRVQTPTSPWEINEVVSRYGNPIAPTTPEVPTVPVSKSRLVVVGTNLKIVEFK